MYFFLLTSYVFPQEECIILDGYSKKPIFQLGDELDVAVCPCSTFKIALSLIGFEEKILIDTQHPIWDFQQDYDDFLNTWKQPHFPLSWMQNSCIWYSKLLSQKIGLKKLQDYLACFDYGNHDISWGLVTPGKQTPFWVPPSSLKISPRQQVEFIQKLLLNTFHLNPRSVEKTKELLFKANLEPGLKLYGKTGWSGSIKPNQPLEYGWFVGWVESSSNFFPFAYLILGNQLNLDARIPRVISLIEEAKILHH